MLTSRFREPEVGLGRINENKDWGGEEGRLDSAAVGDGLKSDDYVAGDVLGEGK